MECLHVVLVSQIVVLRMAVHLVGFYIGLVQVLETIKK
jgi:hypothetical protein